MQYIFPGRILIVFNEAQFSISRDSVNFVNSNFLLIIVQLIPASFCKQLPTWVRTVKYYLKVFLHCEQVKEYFFVVIRLSCSAVGS